MSVLKVLPEHKGLMDVINSSKSERKFGTEIPKPCTEIKFDDFTKKIVNKSFKVPSSNPNDYRTNIDSIKEKLPDLAKSFLEYPGVCVAGGSLVSIIKKKQNHGDFDIFFYGLKIQEIIKMLNSVFEKHKIRDFSLVRNVLNISANHNSYQLILVEYRTPQEIIQYFDIGVCQTCITKHHLYVTDYARFCLLNNVIIYDTDQCISNSYNKRISKYFYHKDISVIFPHIRANKQDESYEFDGLEITNTNIWHRGTYNSNNSDDYDGATMYATLYKYIIYESEHIPFLNVTNVNISASDVEMFKDVCNYIETIIGSMENKIRKANEILPNNLKISEYEINKNRIRYIDRYEKFKYNTYNGVLKLYETKTENDLLNAFTMHYSKPAKEVYGHVSDFQEQVIDEEYVGDLPVNEDNNENNEDDEDDENNEDDEDDEDDEDEDEDEDDDEN